MTAALTGFLGGGYPERDDKPQSKLERAVTATRFFSDRLSTKQTNLKRIVDAVNARTAGVEVLEDDQLLARANALKPRLRKAGVTDIDLVAEAFAMIRAASFRTLGKRHFDVQLVGAWAMLNGMLAEMETGEGKSLTAILVAAAGGLAGHAVHVITVNDYLAERDSKLMAPVYEKLGLSVGFVNQGLDPESRKAAYRCDITYCSNKEITFDYLRDRLAMGGKARPIATKLSRLENESDDQPLLLRGLQFAIVDEADSVLVDEARTPLILSAEARQGGEVTVHHEALELAQQLADSEFRVTDDGIVISDDGLERLADLAHGMKGVWAGPRRREQLVRQALAALHQFERDKHYLVSDDKVVIIDEYTGRLMPDRSWEQGLHQLIEIKEGCEVTGRRDTLARISYQRFFRRYLHLCGMTGTASEVASELWNVYGLRVSRIPTNKPTRRRYYPPRYFGRADDKWKAVIESIEKHRALGRPVLIGTRSVATSEQLAALLDTEGLPYSLLNARQDKDEAEIVALAGEPGRITVATNMAGRGTDIQLAPGVGDKGGLHVIATELHDSGRIDRQLFGRCGRQGDQGSCEAILAVEDDLVRSQLGRTTKPLHNYGALPSWLGRSVFLIAQARAERLHSRIRRDLFDMDENLGNMLAFSGRSE
ncbi:MAG TPA: preprotein translocase subunit SecA [Burkholderiales bacterium]|nr:preprotein translocase subunit SecA [Burkholderiales bacterium]